MPYLLSFLLLFAQPATVSLSSLIDGVNRTFARMKDFSADFVQIGENPLNRKQQASGHLYLMNPHKMRMEYESPESQLYVSDGSTFYSYVPADHQVRETKVRQSTDDRIPLLLVVGRADLRAEFTRFERPTTKPVVEGTQVVRMYPKRKLDYTEFTIEVDPQSFLIRRLVVTNADGSLDEFLFNKIQTNTGLKDSLFHFTPPVGVEVVEGGGR